MASNLVVLFLFGFIISECVLDTVFQSSNNMFFNLRVNPRCQYRITQLRDVIKALFYHSRYTKACCYKSITAETYIL